MKYILSLITFFQFSCSSGLNSEAESVNERLTSLIEVMKGVNTDSDWKTAKEEVSTLVDEFDQMSRKLEDNMDSYDREERNEFDDWKRPILMQLRDELVDITNQITADTEFTMGYDIKNAFRKLGDSGYLSDVSPRVEVGESANRSYR